MATSERPNGADPAPVPPTRLRVLWWLVAYLALGLGLLGVVVPLLPTVPFILLAAYAAARGSHRLHTRLLTDPRTGPMIRNWNEDGAVSRSAKLLATGTMTVCAVVLFLFAPALWIPIAVTAMMVSVGTWLWFRPEPRPEDQTTPADASAERR